MPKKCASILLRLFNNRGCAIDDYARWIFALCVFFSEIAPAALLNTKDRMEPKILIRKAVDLDIPMMQRFIFAHGQNPWNFLPEKEVKEHIVEISSQKVQAYIADIDHDCVGFACFYLGLPLSCQKYQEKSDRSVAYLSEIVVDREHVGKGIGSALVQAVKEFLKEKKDISVVCRASCG